MDMAKPIIRFKGYQDDWEQRKLSEIALQTYGGGTPKTANEEFWKGNIPWIQSSDLIEERLFNVKPRKYISQEAISKSATKLVPQNSVAIVTRVGVGKLAFMPFSYATSQDFLSLSELKIEPEFAVYALYKMMRLVSNEVQGTSIKGITKDELLAKEILIPDYEEQKKIGAYLHNLDHLITLHQRKCDETKRLKKYMLQKMFPQNGEKVPEIRFSGFTDDWEQRKSGEIAPLRGGFAFKSNEYSPDGVPIVRISNILSDGSVGSDFAYYGEQNSDDMYALYDGAVVLAMSGATTGKISVLHTKKGQKYYQNQRVGYFTPTDSCDYGFIKTIMRSQLFAEQLSSVLVAGAQPNVSSREIDGFEFMIPKSKDEQQKIGVYFSKLDHLITLHQRELENLQNIKKFMLGKMFV